MRPSYDAAAVIITQVEPSVLILWTIQIAVSGLTKSATPCSKVVVSLSGMIDFVSVTQNSAIEPPMVYPYSRYLLKPTLLPTRPKFAS